MAGPRRGPPPARHTEAHGRGATTLFFFFFSPRECLCVGTGPWCGVVCGRGGGVSQRQRDVHTIQHSAGAGAVAVPVPVPVPVPARAAASGSGSRLDGGWVGAPGPGLLDVQLQAMHCCSCSRHIRRPRPGRAPSAASHRVAGPTRPSRRSRPPSPRPQGPSAPNAPMGRAPPNPGTPALRWPSPSPPWHPWVARPPRTCCCPSPAPD